MVHNNNVHRQDDLLSKLNGLQELDVQANFLALSEHTAFYLAYCISSDCCC